MRWLWCDADDIEAPAGCDGAVVVSDDAATATRIARVVQHYVVTGCQPEAQTVAAVYCDPIKVGEMAAEHFCDLGYQSLAFLGIHSVADNMRWCGFRDAARKHELMPIQYQPTHLEAPSASCVADQDLRSWITKIPRKTGIFVTDDRRAANLCELAREANITIPEDLAIISLGHDRDAASFARPRLSFIDVPWEHLGFQAAELLSGMLSGEAPRHIVIEPHRVVQRASTQGMAVDDKQLLAAVHFIRDTASTHRSSRCAQGTTPSRRRWNRSLNTYCIGPSWRKSVADWTWPFNSSQTKACR